MKWSIRRINEILIVILALIGVVLLLGYLRFDQINFTLMSYLNMHPTTTILGIHVVDAINTFAGTDLMGFSITWKTASIYWNVIFYLMIGPYLLFKGFKKAKEAADRIKPWYWYAGAVICLASILVIPAEIIHMVRFENQLENTAESRLADSIRTEILEVGFAVAEHEILEGGLTDSFSLSDLSISDLEHTYEIKGVNDHRSVKIIGTSAELPEFKAQITVRPYQERIISWRN